MTINELLRAVALAALVVVGLILCGLWLLCDTLTRALLWLPTLSYNRLNDWLLRCKEKGKNNA